MSYALIPHREALVHAATKGAVDLRWFVLLDTAQLDAAAHATCRKAISSLPIRFLFEDTFAKNALALSPVLVEIDTDLEALIGLDVICHGQPVLALLWTALDLDSLVRHLRDQMLIEADGEPFMLRMADTQMLAAINQAFSPAQRRVFFKAIQAWWLVDHAGQLKNMADPLSFPQATAPAHLPHQLDDSQLQALLAASEACALASQLRQLTPSFDQMLDHAKQTAFAWECIEHARMEALDMDAELTTFALKRWEATQ